MIICIIIIIISGSSSSSSSSGGGSSSSSSSGSGSSSSSSNPPQEVLKDHPCSLLDGRMVRDLGGDSGVPAELTRPKLLVLLLWTLISITIIVTIIDSYFCQCLFVRRAS